ncbi:MAG: GNAT family N-acetyltransferase [Candidatus Marinimicrobia bacterium]|jgi:predicted GNAT superfamily acetyltransferase|nr:GNAT family N-acetyltransferase [Candidatus Neomarinimicrobiota bacterium]MDP6499458.1 GNAT family N-acetyltransferase [Candidatus Neomarinimicrobiota bacterium]MDP6725722.1 GNAT family N-acetyltransferase [Candidatus Neomarinimicrobiota bacterium]|tara:strand:- start:1339 stop:1770 length:432 start_codon:yes stop_codon:yes gene_type:complete
MISVKTGQLTDAINVSNKIPEFERPYKRDEYKKRLSGKHLILTAYINDEPVGFKVGYDRFNDGSFYSWMGGVLPRFRKMGVAQLLLAEQEAWAVQNGFSAIKLKTRKKHGAMLEFSLKRGFVIMEKIPKIPENETRIWMEKEL